jgi:nitrogen fixation/metabolism regulation signal transduction histidine kinase
VEPEHFHYMTEQTKKSSVLPETSASEPRGLRLTHLVQHIIDTMPMGIVVFDHKLDIIDCNANARKLLAQAQTVSMAIAAQCKAPSECNWDEKLLQALAVDGPTVFESVTCCRNGRTYILHIICIPLTPQQFNSQPGGILLIEDITAKAMMEKDLASAERLASVGKLAARVAHELNNPLDGILRYINLALRIVEENDSQDQTAHYLRESRKGLLRMAQIVTELLEFSRSTYSALEEANVNTIVTDAVKAMETQAAANKVEVLCRFTDNVPHIRSGNLFQVFCNLIKNAIDAMPDGGKLDIKTRCSDSDLIISFADTGTGLTEEAKEKMFEPFFTTKAAGKGTGLGLAICKDIIERYNGRIMVQNQPEGGCLFTIVIPLERTTWASR